jgi:hypothetical protein
VHFERACEHPEKVFRGGGQDMLGSLGHYLFANEVGWALKISNCLI